MILGRGVGKRGMAVSDETAGLQVDDQEHGENALLLINLSPTRPTWMAMGNWTTPSLHR